MHWAGWESAGGEINKVSIALPEPGTGGGRRRWVPRPGGRPVPCVCVPPVLPAPRSSSGGNGRGNHRGSPPAASPARSQPTPASAAMREPWRGWCCRDPCRGASSRRCPWQRHRRLFFFFFFSLSGSWLGKSLPDLAKQRPALWEPGHVPDTGWRRWMTPGNASEGGRLQDWEGSKKNKRQIIE